MAPTYRMLAERRLKRGRRVVARGVEKARARTAARHGTGIIFYYHRIAEPVVDPWRTSVSPENFRQHLEVLQAEARQLSLDDMLAAARAGKIPDRAVAITFDDGYVDNLQAALPLLKRYQQPATFYVATGYIGRPAQFWWDEIADLMLGPGPRPPRLEARFGSRLIECPTATPTERRDALYGEINQALKRLPPSDIEASMEAVRDWVGQAVEEPGREAASGSERRPMTAAEIEALAASEWAEIGAHTSLHPSLPAVEPAVQREEMAASLETLTELCGAPPRSFAYPFGDNDRGSRRIARELGFDNAVSAEGVIPITTAADDFAIPRVFTRDEGGEEFATRIANVFRFVDPT